MTADPQISIGSSDLPSLYGASDMYSLAAQERAVKLLAVGLTTAIIAATASSFEATGKAYGFLCMVVAVSFCVGLVCSSLMLAWRPERKWYSNRAVAESVKSIAWKYMTGAPPFEMSLTSQGAEGILKDELETLLKQTSKVGVDKCEHNDAITDMMRRVRNSTLETRLETYMQYRVDDQCNWYRDKSNWNAQRAVKWLIASIVMQAVAAMVAVAMIFNEDALFNPAGVFAAIASSMMAWLQFRRHQELEQSYHVAHQELALARMSSSQVESVEQLARYVADTETAISREHTGWLARRELH